MSLFEPFLQFLEVYEAVLSLRNKMDVSREIHKRHMAVIVDQFANAYVSRFRHRGLFDEDDPDNGPHWAIYLTRTTEVNTVGEKQFQAINCVSCGNYKMCKTFRPERKKVIKKYGLQYYYDNMGLIEYRAIHPKLRCKCV